MPIPEQFPEVSEPLVKALDQLFPDRCPAVADSDRQIWIKAGQRKVVEFLQKKLHDQLADKKEQHVSAQRA